MKKLIFTAIVLMGATTLFGQTSNDLTIKAIAEDENTGKVFEIRSDLPSVPEDMILQSNGNVLTIDGVFIGVAVPLMANGEEDDLLKNLGGTNDLKKKTGI